MRTTFSFLLALILISCVSQKKVMNSLLGQGKAQILQVLGIPDQTIDDGEGGELLAFTKVKQTFSMSQNNPSQTYYEHTYVHIGISGVVDSWRIENSPTPVQQINVNVRRVPSQTPVATGY